MGHCKVISLEAAEAEYKDFYRPVSERLGYIVVLNCLMNQVKKGKQCFLQKINTKTPPLEAGIAHF